jgi:hypothetical protein
MTNRTIGRSLALFGLLVGSSGLIGCSVPPEEVTRQTTAAYQHGYGDGERAEQARCEERVEKIEAANREEKAELEAKILWLETTTVTAVGMSGLLLLGGAAFGAVYFVRCKRREADDPDPWRYKKPPPSVVTEEV